MDGERPSIESRSGLSIFSTNCRAYAESDSMYLLCPSAKMVSNAREDLPEPLTPVTTMKLSLGIFRSIFFRLCSLAPMILIVSKVALFYLVLPRVMN